MTLQQQHVESSCVTVEHDRATQVLFDWTNFLEVLKSHEDRLRAAPSKQQNEGDFDSSWKRYLVHQLSQYAHQLLRTSSAAGTKRLVRDTRLALRCACLSVAQAATNEENVHERGDGRSQSRAVLQESLIRDLGVEDDGPLLEILAAPSDRGDAKCRMLAARLWCNLLTDHLGNCQRIATAVPLSPSPTEQRQQQLRKVLDPNLSVSSTEDREVESTLPPARSASWWKFVRCSSSNREALAAVVAALYNAMMVGLQVSEGSFPPSETTTDAGALEDRRSLCCMDQRIASDSLVLCTLLRQVVPPQAVLQPRADSSPTAALGAEEVNPRDEAAEWILLLVEKLVRRGHLPAMYATVSGGAAADIPTAALPEHLVLLHCVRVVGQLPANAGGTSKSPWRMCDSWSDTRRCLTFLANVYVDLNPPFAYGVLSDRNVDVDVPTNLMERTTVSNRLLDLLADNLVDEEPGAHELRLVLGASKLMPSLARKLARLVDKYTTLMQSQARAASAQPDHEPARRQFDVIMPHHEQEELTNLVRLIGNLCYRCRPNQDQMRTMLVPFSTDSSPDDGSSWAHGVDAPARTLLHVVLSSTGLAPLCFTVREWAVVAIRSALQDHAENQAFLAALQALEPVPSAALKQMGIRVDLDNRNGKVQVVPLDADAADKKGGKNLDDSCGS